MNIFWNYSFYVQELQNGQPSNISLIQSDRKIFNLLRFVNEGGKVDVYVELLKPIETVITDGSENQGENEGENADEGAYNWSVDKPPVHWSRSHFSTFPKCDILVNNICENFNKCVLDARSKPIIGLLEGMRNYMMSRMQACREKVQKWDGLICHKIQERIEIAKKEARGCIATCSGNKKLKSFKSHLCLGLNT